MAGQLGGHPSAWMTGGDYHTWPIKWVEDSEKVAIGAYSDITFGTATVNANGSIKESRSSYRAAM